MDVWTLCSHLSVDGKDGADGYEAVDVGGAVQRIETHDVFALEVKKKSKETRFLEEWNSKSGQTGLNWFHLTN